MRLFKKKTMTLAYFSGIKGVSTPPTFTVFQLQTIPPSPSASACCSQLMCIMIVHAYTQSGLLRHGVGEVSLKKTFPVPTKFNYKIWLFPPKLEVFVLQYQNLNS